MKYKQKFSLWKNGVLLLTLHFSLLTFTSCTTDTYESGDGENSYLRGDFGVVTTNAKAQAISFVNDDDEAFTLTSPVDVKGAEADTTYRAIIYYDDNGTRNVKMRGMTGLSVCQPFLADTIKVMKTDPVGWESAWMSANGKYLNLGLNLKTGVSDDDQNLQVLGIARDMKNNKQHIKPVHHHLTFYHDQNGVPEYYTRQTYVSMPLKKNFISGDTVTISVKTYDGIQKKTLLVP